jgi:hypothetical protein
MVNGSSQAVWLSDIELVDVDEFLRMNEGGVGGFGWLQNTGQARSSLSNERSRATLVRKSEWTSDGKDGMNYNNYVAKVVKKNEAVV